MVLVLLTVCGSSSGSEAVQCLIYSAVISYSVFDFLKKGKHQHCFTCSPTVFSLTAQYSESFVNNAAVRATIPPQLLASDGDQAVRLRLKTEMDHDKHLIGNSLIASENPHMNLYANVPFFSPSSCLLGTVKQRLC